MLNIRYDYPILILEWTGQPTKDLVVKLYEDSLPAELTLCLNDNIYHFRTKFERYQFALGMNAVFLNRE